MRSPPIILLLGLLASSTADAQLPKPNVNTRPATGSKIRLFGTTARRCVAEGVCFVFGESLHGGMILKLKDASGRLHDAAIVKPFATHLGFVAPKATGEMALGVYSGATLVSNEVLLTIIDGRNPGDRDGDGVAGVASRGTDCDDADPDRYPGNPEVCDEFGHDEDCNPGTVAQSQGTADVDRDGLNDARCCNVVVEADGTRLAIRCATDCDDTNYAIQIGSQKCAGSDPSMVLVCAPPPIDANMSYDKKLLATYTQWPPMMGEYIAPWEKRPCPAGSKCFAQPNGTAICR